MFYKNLCNVINSFQIEHKWYFEGVIFQFSKYIKIGMESCNLHHVTPIYLYLELLFFINKNIYATEIKQGKTSDQLRNPIC